MNRPSTSVGSAVNHSPVRLWTEFVILGLGLPAAIWVASKLIKLSVPSATQGSPEERFLWWIIGPAVAEGLFVLWEGLVFGFRPPSLEDIGVLGAGRFGALAFSLGFSSPSNRGQL